MTTEEFSNEFDTLVDSYRRFKKFDDKEELDSLDFNEYEKSIFLTLAQDEVVLGLYNGTNYSRNSFESNEETRRYLSDLIKTCYIEPIAIKSDKNTKNLEGLTENSQFFKLPSELWFITYESATINDEKAGCKNNSNILVVPVTLDSFYDINDNPFRGPSKRRALRLDISENTVELVSKYKLSKYIIRYLEKPSPIVLIHLPGGLKIENTSEKTECKLNSALHNEILEVAVRNAIMSKVGAGSK